MSEPQPRKTRLPVAVPVLLGIVLFRLTLRDHVPYLAVLYYMTPWIAVGVWSLVLGLLSARRRSWIHSLVLVVAGLGMIGSQNQVREPRAEEIDVRLFLGNLESSKSEAIAKKTP